MTRPSPEPGLLDVLAGHAARVLAADPLAGGQDRLPKPGPGEELIEVPGAVGLAAVDRSDPDTMHAAWGPPVVHRLHARVGGADPEAALGALLDAWTADARPGPLAVLWPSRDTAAVRALALRGFAPTVVIAARPRRPTATKPGTLPRSALPHRDSVPPRNPQRPTPDQPNPRTATRDFGQTGPRATRDTGQTGLRAARDFGQAGPWIASRDSGEAGPGAAARDFGQAGPGGAARDPGFRVRPAVAGDLGGIVRLYEALVAYDGQFGWVRPRQATAARIREYLSGTLPRSWAWVAEREGAVIGTVIVDPPPRSRWISAMVTRMPAAYLGVMYADPAVRGRGVGAALAAAAHARLDASGVATTLLHHAVANPLSSPFWARQGYRPVFTQWVRQGRPSAR